MSDRGNPKTFFFDVIPAAVFIVCLAFVWLARFLPLQDYPDWLYQGFLFRELLGGHHVSGFSLAPAVVPNAVSTYLIGVFAQFMPGETAGKVFLTLLLAVWIFGLKYFLASFTPKRPWGILVAVFYAFNIHFYLGNVNYLFGLGVLFFGLGRLVRTAFQDYVRGSDVLFYSAALFICHMVPFGIYVLAVLILAPRKKAGLFLLPTLLLAVYYVFYHMGLPAGDVGGYSLAKVIGNTWNAFSLLVDVYPVSVFGAAGSWLAAFVNGVAVAVVFSVILLALWPFHKNEDDVHRPLRLLIGVCVVLSLALCGSVAKVSALGERFLFPAFFLSLPIFLQLFERHFRGLAQRSHLAGGMGLFLALLLVIHGLVIFKAGQALAAWKGGLERYISASDVMQVRLRYFEFEGVLAQEQKHNKFVPMVTPCDRMPFYVYIQKGWTSYVDWTFDTGIFIPRERLRPCLASGRFSQFESQDCHTDRIVLTGRLPVAEAMAQKKAADYTPVWQDACGMVLERKAH